MRHFLTRRALAVLGTFAVLCLAACAPTTSGSTATPTATPARVPAGWKVLTTTYFSLAYPPDWTPVAKYVPKNYPGEVAYTDYFLNTPDGHAQLDVFAAPVSSVPLYCRVARPQAQPTTLAGLPMRYALFVYPDAPGGVRWWSFVNAQKMGYGLRAYDGDASAATKAQDDAILATFRPDDATPLQC